MHDTQTVIADRTVEVQAAAAEHSLLGTSIRFTLITTLLLGIAYPLIVTGIASVLFPHQAAGSLIEQNGQVIGSQLLAQGFASDKYFHPRPSAAGSGYDATSSGGSNLAQSSAKLVQRVQGDIDKLAKENPNTPVPIDLVTTSGSGLDPDITPDAAYFQALRIAHARGLTEPQVRQLIAQHVSARQFGVLGEPRVNVLELNLDLDKLSR
ncbi:MAG: potassium-transporting ATPase subunit KdpC [Terracidiphilus sp.]|nr:potassium-transporting ATPase subunit KdpC [Terracidiphilus sp.]